MSAPEPRANPLLLGHGAAEGAMLAAVAAGRVHHAWLMHGPEGVGKATLAFRFARCLLAGEGRMALEAGHPVFRRVAAGTHADLLTVEREWDEKRRRMRAEIGVDDVRGIADFLQLTPAEGGWRVVVVDGAEFLNRNAANALLKVLEEPPPRAVLLLACAAPGRLLATIRSRCRRLALGRLGEADMTALVTRYLPEADGVRLVPLVEGSPGRALRLAEADAGSLAALVEEVLGGAPGMPMARMAGRAEQVAKGEGFAIFMELLREGVANAVRATARGEGSPAQRRFAEARPLARWVEVWHALARLQSETERFNLDKRHAVLSSLALLNET